MDFATEAKKLAPEIDKIIQQTLQSWKNDAKSKTSDLDHVLDQLIKASVGGKRLRGMLIILGYQLAGKKYTDEILYPAAAIEIFQTGILAHDDIIDKSPLRRGKPTIYKALGENHYAISQTICLGDVGLLIGPKLIAESNFDPTLKNKAISMFCQMVINTGLGEMLDVELPRLEKNKTEKAVLTIHELKTAYYTIIYPLKIGAILGGAPDSMLQKFEIYGYNLGIAFQLQDDILGVFGDEKELGKSVTSDIEEGKNTLLLTEALKRANKEQLLVLEKYYGQGKIGEKELVAIRQVFEDTGSLEYSKQKALEYVSQAKAVIPEMTKDPEFVRLLEDFSDFMINRSK